MNEREYIETVALTRVRLAIDAMRGVVLSDTILKPAVEEVVHRLYELEETLGARVNVK